MQLCTPALIYFLFSLIQIILDTFNGMTNVAITKTIVMVVITLLLNALCTNDMSIVAWIIVFIPFIFMSVIVGLLLYAFGLNEPQTTSYVLPQQQNGNVIFVKRQL